MIAPCDGCGKIFNHKLIRINAKQWYPNHCSKSIEESHYCEAADCRYSCFGEVCAEFQFCLVCNNTDGLVDSVFSKFNNGI